MKTRQEIEEHRKRIKDRITEHKQALKTWEKVKDTNLVDKYSKLIVMYTGQLSLIDWLLKE